MTRPVADGILTFGVDPKYTNNVPAPDGCTKCLSTDTCAAAKNVASAVVASLAALVIVFTTLVIITQQLGICPDVASLLQPKMAYLILATGVLVLAADTVLMISLTRSYLDKLYTDHEMVENSFRQQIDSTHLWELMPEGSCWDVVFPSNKPNDHPPAYVVLRKEEGCRFFHAFKLLSDQQEFLRQQLEEKGLRDAKAEFSRQPEYPLSFIEKRFVAAGHNFNSTTHPILNSNTLNPHLHNPRFYETYVTNIPHSSEPLVIMRRNHGTQEHPHMVTHFYKGAAFDDLYGPESSHAKLVSLNVAQGIAFETADKVVKAPLKSMEYWSFEFKVGKTKVYGVRYRVGQHVPVATQISLDKGYLLRFLEAARNETDSEWIDAESNFEHDDDATYEVTYVTNNVDIAELQRIDQPEVPPNQVRCHHVIRTKNNKEIYPLQIRPSDGSPTQHVYYKTRVGLRNKLVALGIS